ncbi:hypothetical protein [Rheinheimera sp. MMS21-TC3]|uniref:hypothetical protein n=1 Tax=Rheinheimera sp. MMS21-TC3 TaxID=3072790 RepID=UPI0028C458A8|nr:hypothetical protein [Rheinheimera sp. MMS21-TC3]WNO61367.1 hypothetical protein RDV63_10510 [Rheinheimera sp. MMS21-TC3]
MDAFMPFVQRVAGGPVEQDARLVVPVFRDAKLSLLKPHEQKYLILRRPRYGKKMAIEDVPEAPYTTPEDEQKVGEDGRLDIFV